MVHVRLNTREVNPNPYINFITPLTGRDADSEERARQVLRALAAQIKPIMKDHGFVVNSLEEYEYNKVFAGRNWNNGEVVEIVLRSSTGGFLPTPWLLGTLCHELAHIKHMNHGPAFQALWRQLNNEVRSLQARGYFGDGYFSSGTRLSDSRTISGEGLQSGELPEYMCGGAHSRSKPTSYRRQRARRNVGPSLHTGRQTAKKRKAGSRITGTNVFIGEGKSLVANTTDSIVGTGFGKRTQSKQAREDRALAAERRIQALQALQAKEKMVQLKAESKDLRIMNKADTHPTGDKSHNKEPGGTSDEGESDEEVIPESDSDRLRALLDSESGLDLEELRRQSFWDALDIGSMERCELPLASGSKSTTSASGQDIGTSVMYTSTAEKGKARATGSNIHPSASRSKSQTSSQSTKSHSSLGLGKLVQSEIEFRKKESLGMTPIPRGGRKLGEGNTDGGKSLAANNHSPRSSRVVSVSCNDEAWSCLVCTLDNDALHLACSVCGTPKGSQTWHG